MSQENMEVIRGMYESFSRGDVPAVLGQMDQHIEWREGGGELHLRGS
jgi:ketosteroid isomerase-like protein